MDAAHAQVVASGGRIDYALTNEPFDQRRFGFFDPSGLWIDVVQQIDSAPGYWDRYMQPEPALQGSDPASA